MVEFYEPIFTEPVPQPSVDPGVPDSTFRWGTVASLSPLTVLLDGDSTPLAGEPDTLVTDLAVGARVWCQLFRRRVIVLGRSKPPSIDPEEITAGLAEGLWMVMSPMATMTGNDYAEPEFPTAITVGPGVSLKVDATFVTTVVELGGDSWFSSTINYQVNGGAWTDLTQTFPATSAIGYYAHQQSASMSGRIPSHATATRSIDFRASTYNAGVYDGRLDYVGLYVTAYRETTSFT